MTKHRLRIKLRTLLFAIAIVGIGFGGTFEWRNRRLRDQYARTEAACLSQAEKHERELAFCRTHLGRDPYDSRRGGNNLEGRWTYFKSWDEEAAWHAEYAEGYRKGAPEQSRLKQFYQRRLLLP